MEKPAQWALVAAAWFLALTVALLGWLAYRRFIALPAAAAAAVAGAEAPLAPGASAVCPVTKQTVTVGPETPSVVYQGRVYYFSDEKDAAGHSAKTRFLMDPQAYLGGSAAPAPETGASAPAPTAVPAAPPTAVPTPLPTAPPRATATPIVVSSQPPRGIVTLSYTAKP
jgi:hypothetical protein